MILLDMWNLKPPFKAAVKDELSRQNLSLDAVKSLLAHADRVDLVGRSRFVREAMEEFRDSSPPDISAVEPSDTIGAVTEQTVAGKTPDLSVAEADSHIFQYYLLDHFSHVIAKVILEYSHDFENEIMGTINSMSPSELLQMRDFFDRHAWIISYFIKGETDVDRMFGAIAQNYNYYSNVAVLQGALYNPKPWIARQEAKIGRFDEILKRYGFEKDGESDPSSLLQNYVDALDQDIHTPEMFWPFFEYFSQEESRVLDDLLLVQSQSDYLEVLADIADIARSRASDASSAEFRLAVMNILVSAVMRDDIKAVVSQFPAFGNREPVARAAREARSQNADPRAVSEAQSKLDEIDIVAGTLRDLSGMTLTVTRRDRSNVIPYERKITEMNGDVRQALWELRRAESDKPTAPRGRQPPPNRTRVERRPKPRPTQRPEMIIRPLESPPPPEGPWPAVTPRSQAELESAIHDLEPPSIEESKT